MKKYRWLIILLNLVLLLTFFNRSVVKKEAIVIHGKLVFFKLAPVDPRSLMQGDYMQLRYEISDQFPSDSIPKRGYCVVKVDSQNIAQKERLQAGIQPLSKEEFLVKYTVSDRGMSIGAESYFFEEGRAAHYEQAEYGGLKIDTKGHSILIGLYDEHLKPIE